MPVRFVRRLSLSDVANGLVIAAIIILFLYVAGVIIQPLVIAALLSFILAPVMRRLRTWGVAKIFAAIFSVALTLSILGLLGVTLVMEARKLAQDLPIYETNLRSKIQLLGSPSILSGALERASTTLRDLQSELSRTEENSSAEQADAKPLTVEIHQPEPRGLDAIANLLRPLLTPLATTALVILFLLFILLQREDIRDRFLNLAGTADLQRSTAALNDAATRLGRFYLTQMLINTCFGAVMGLVLMLIGVPNSVLWGILAGLMRFVPFIGSLIAGFFPVVLAAAADPGWSMPLTTAALFAVSEPAQGQLVEPLVYGRGTGLSPVAIVLSTLFWTLLWGPVGLLLATPLTVCLVVLGKHIEGLKFIDVLLGNEPPLLPEERFYQRLLAGDATEAADQAEEQLKSMSLSTYFDSVGIKGLILAQADAADGKLSKDRQDTLRATMHEILEDLADYQDEGPPETAFESALLEGEPAAPPVAAWAGRALCIASRSPLDEAAAAMLAQILVKRGVPAILQPLAGTTIGDQLAIETTDAKLVCLSYFGAASKPVHVRYLIRRFRRRMPQTQFLACFWMLAEDSGKLEEWRAAVGADFAAASLTQAAEISCRELSRPSRPALTCVTNRQCESAPLLGSPRPGINQAAHQKEVKRPTP